MPAVMEQIDKMSAEEKLRLMGYILKSISASALEQGRGLHRRRIGVMDGKWKIPTWEEDKAMDREIEADFEASLEEPF